MPTGEEIQNIKDLISEAFWLLCSNDTDLISLDDNQVIECSPGIKKYERKLHEVCINHRLAHYIEVLLPQYYSNNYKVDIEFNRCYRNKKHLDISGHDRIVRPDIIVHTRAIRTEYPQHLLIIEAKKDIDSPEDIEIVKSFILDPRYEYSFGLTVRYNDFNPIQATLFYKDTDETIQQEAIACNATSKQ